jgi:hypothetical protein
MKSRTIIFAVLVFLASHPAAPAADTVKTFPAYQCRYTLPGDGWTWVALESGSVLTCKARNRDGLLLSLAVSPAIAEAVIDARYAEKYDEHMAADGRRKKRGGRLTTFKGLPCYQSEWLTNGGNTAAHRVVMADGWRYQLMLVGKGDPVEKQPDFEAIMNGFEFTFPPVPPALTATTDSADDEKNPAYLAGKVLGYCAIGMFLVGLTRWGRRRK